MPHAGVEAREIERTDEMRAEDISGELLLAGLRLLVCGGEGVACGDGLRAGLLLLSVSPAIFSMIHCRTLFATGCLLAFISRCTPATVRTVNT